MSLSRVFQLEKEHFVIFQMSFRVKVDTQMKRILALFLAVSSKVWAVVHRRVLDQQNKWLLKNALRLNKQ